jgi:predicted P-loop ATPase/GTPase
MAPRIIIVSGLLAYDSGKTWLLIGLAKKLRDRGCRVAVSKPVAGHSMWSQFKTYLHSLENRVLVGEDVMKYVTLLGLDKSLIPIINPIDIMLAPPDPAKYIDSGNVDEYLSDLEDQFKQMILARYTDCASGGSRHFIFEENVERLPRTLKQLVERLASVLNAEKAKPRNFIETLHSLDLEKNLMLCLESISKGSDVVLVESFNDAVTPYPQLLKIASTLLVVMPAAVAVYRDLGKIESVVRDVTKKLGEAGFRTSVLMSRLRPEKLISFAPRTHELEPDEAFDSLADIVNC